MTSFFILIIILGLIYHFEPSVDLEEGLLWYNTDRRLKKRNFIRLFNKKKIKLCGKNAQFVTEQVLIQNICL